MAIPVRAGRRRRAAARREASPHPAAPPRHRHPVPRRRLHHPRESVTPGPAEAAAAGQPCAPGGGSMINPLVGRELPTEWPLLWVQGLAQPNKDDLKVKENPQKLPAASVLWPPLLLPICSEPGPLMRYSSNTPQRSSAPSAPPTPCTAPTSTPCSRRTRSTGTTGRDPGRAGDPRHARLRRPGRGVMRTALGADLPFTASDPFHRRRPPTSSGLAVGGASAGFHSSPRR